MPRSRALAIAFIDAYYSYSDDGGDNWQEHRLTADPFNSGDDGFGGTFIGDYLSLAIGSRRAYPCYMSTQNGDADIFIHVIALVGDGDYDSDGDVDLDDFAHWPACMTGPDAGPYDAPCEAFDFDADAGVDLGDYGGFQRALAGP